MVPIPRRPPLLSPKMLVEPNPHNQALVFPQARISGFHGRCVNSVVCLPSVLPGYHFLCLFPPLSLSILCPLHVSSIFRERTENKHTDRHYLCTSHASRTAHYCMGIIVTLARVFILRQLKNFLFLFVMGLSRSIRNQPVNEPPHRRHGQQKEMRSKRQKKKRNKRKETRRRSSPTQMNESEEGHELGSPRLHPVLFFLCLSLIPLSITLPLKKKKKKITRIKTK